MSGKIVEYNKIDLEVLGISSAAGATSQAYDMREYPQAAVIVNVEGSYVGGVSLDLMESSQATAAGSSAAGSKAGITIGATANTALSASNGARAITLTHGTGATGATGDVFTLSLGTVSKSFTFSTSTANHNSTAWTTAALYYGSTVGSSANTGPQGCIDTLRTALMSTKGYGNMLVCSTPTTNTLTSAVADSDPGCIGFASTGDTALAVVMVNQAVGAFDLRADQMTSTANKRYLSVKVSTASSACRAAVTVIRSGGRYIPPAGVKYRLSS